jgi:hypothetical protein
MYERARFFTFLQSSLKKIIMNNTNVQFVRNSNYGAHTINLISLNYEFPTHKSTIIAFITLCVWFYALLLRCNLSLFPFINFSLIKIWTAKLYCRSCAVWCQRLTIIDNQLITLFEVLFFGLGFFAPLQWFYLLKENDCVCVSFISTLHSCLIVSI